MGAPLREDLITVTVEGQAYVEAAAGPRDLAPIEGADHTFTAIS